MDPDRTIATVSKIDGRVAAPASKSATQRALIAAALASGRSQLRHPLVADDSRHLLAALDAVGIPARIDASGADPVFEIEGQGGAIPAGRAAVSVGNAGTAMRFLTAMLALGRGEYVIDGDPRMRQRPIEDLLAALRALGAEAVSLAGNGCPPVRVGGAGLRGGSVRLKGGTSSQYLSAILLAAPAMPHGVRLEVEGPLVSRPYVDLTLGVMRRFGAEVETAPAGPEPTEFVVRPGRPYRPCDIEIEGDYSSASYFFAAAAVTGGRVRVDRLDPDSSQGDARFVDLLERMGCRVERGDSWVAVHGTADLRGLDADCRAMPDIVPTLAVVALFARGPTRITGVPHLKVKESDRIAAVCGEIDRMGGGATPLPDGLVIEPRPLHGARIETHADHRIAMAFAVAGLRVPGVVIADPGCVSKSFPDFWARFEKLTRRQKKPPRADPRGRDAD